MKNLIPGYFFSLAAILLGCGSLFISYLRWLKKLDVFRANLKPGDMVKVKMNEKVFRARLVGRGNGFIRVVKDIDTKANYFAELKNIYQP